MLLGKPVIYPTTGGILEYMVEGQTGLSYTAGDVDGRVDRLEQLIADPSRWPVMGNFRRCHAAKLFSKDGFGGEVNRTLLELRAQGNATTRMPATIKPYVSSSADLPATFGGRIGAMNPVPVGPQEI